MKKKILFGVVILLLVSLLTGCSHETKEKIKYAFDITKVGEQIESLRNRKDKDGKDKDGKDKEKPGKHDKDKKENLDDIELTEEEIYRILEQSGYGKDIDWASKTDDDPSIPKDMDVTRDVKSIEKAYHVLSPKSEDPGDLYDRPWWDYIPASYDLSGDVFPATDSYAGGEKEYNNSLEQGLIPEYNGYTTGQAHDIWNAQFLAKSFIYEESKNKYRWIADLDKLCRTATSLDIADFQYKICERPIKKDEPGEYIDPTFMTATYDRKIVDYDLIGIPQFGGYEFTITVWAQSDKPVGWINDYTGEYLDEKEVYENMGEWDFYDELNASSNVKKVEKPKLPNGAMIVAGKGNEIAKEQYIYCKGAMDTGNVYYYSNGVTVDMWFYGGTQGGSYEDALEYCRIICGNK